MSQAPVRTFPGTFTLPHAFGWCPCGISSLFHFPWGSPFFLPHLKGRMKAPGSSTSAHFPAHGFWQPAGSSPVPPLSSSSPSLHRFLSFTSLFSRNPVLRDGLTKLPGKSVYFEALLPSRAVSLNILSSMGFIKPSPSTCGICLQHRGTPSHGHRQPLHRSVGFVLLFLHDV